MPRKVATLESRPEWPEFELWRPSRGHCCDEPSNGWTKGNIKQLEGALAGYCRLRVRGYRIIIRFYVEQGRRVARFV